MDVCTLSDFKTAFVKLDELISVEIASADNKEFKEKDPLVVKAIGGFALLYHELRFSGVTADVDSATQIPDCYKDLIKRVGHELLIPEDWLNDHSQSAISETDGKWETVDWNLLHIKIYVLNVRELIIDKCGWAEKYLSGVALTERDKTKDLNDFLGILWKLHVEYNSVEELKAKLVDLLDISLDDYPSVCEYIKQDLEDEGISWT